MGNQESRPGFCAEDAICGFANRASTKPPWEDADPAIAAVAGWIAAREAGDVELAASYCHKEFVFASPQVSRRRPDPLFFDAFFYFTHARLFAHAQLLLLFNVHSSRSPGSRRRRSGSFRSRRRCRWR